MDRPTNLMVINSVELFDEPPDWQRVRQVIQRRLVDRYPRFRQRVVESRLRLRGPRWEDDPDYALEHHVHHLALPPPGDRAALQELIGDLVTMPLERNRPLWHAYLVDGFGDGAAIINRMHHCIADGIALAGVKLSLTDSSPDAGIAPATHERHHERADGASAIKGDPGMSRRVAWGKPLSLAHVKDVAHSHDATVNDVLLAALSGGLRHYLRDRGALVHEIQAMVPFNLRPLDEPVPRELGNKFGLVFLPLPVGVSGSYGRLVGVHKRMSEIKEGPSPSTSLGPPCARSSSGLRPRAISG
jgi:diacylglycerol O-acyltransferase / wax synthase